MGRELKRVPLDFDWPLHMPWKGYVSPYRSQDCKACGGTGLNPESKQISDDWYDFAGTGRRWDDKITQDEVQALVDAGRLWDFTREFIPGKGWQEKEPPYVPTAEEVNEWSRKRGIGHDGLNRGICVEARCKRLGVWGYCKYCNGSGEIWHSLEVKELADEWEGYDPPEGEGYQLWETVSEGSPISPVFSDAEAFVAYLQGEGYSETAARAFVEAGWVPSGVVVGGTFYQNIESLAATEA
jgi:hypothetical protein